MDWFKESSLRVRGNNESIDEDGLHKGAAEIILSCYVTARYSSGACSAHEGRLT